MRSTSNALTYTVPRYRIALVREAGLPAPRLRQAGARRWHAETVSEPQHAARLLKPLFAGLDREQMVVCCLDAKHRPIGINVVSVGTLTESLVHPREVFKPAILLNASALILAHNHPSGDATPSAEDRRLTTRLQDAGALLGISVLDHLVFGDPAVHSVPHGLIRS